MARGGARPGTGNRGGARKGAGRKKGAATAKTREIADRIAADGDEQPLEYMIRVMRDKTAEDARRDDMAKQAAPYIHPKLAAVEHTGKGGGPIQVNITSEDAGIL